MLCYVDIDNDTGILVWDGGVWKSFSELDTGANGNTGRGQDCEFETASGRGAYMLGVYSDTTGVRYRTATTTPNWAAEASVSTIGDSFWVQTERADDGTIMAVTLDDNVDDDIIASYWNGSSWSLREVLETNPSSVLAAPYEVMNMAAKRYQFTQGVVRSTPISFAYVPSQPTWGDITFGSTEPFGTEVLVRVKYTNSSTCDTYVPDIALSGNSAGFDSTEVPINISALSTTTYNQLCLEATITTLGSASASLDDWELSWVRQPKLIQSAYRWYVNASTLALTDPWPLGVSDVAESSPIISSEPINTSDVVRLRIALLGSNVALATSSKAFKLQYAAGPTCSLSMSWLDIGEIGSTTASWRGSENSVVGSDWYSASWDRRIKITTNNASVNADVVDFPVYVNLDDLPATFFDNVQADGDDIRITEADGLTELPYELVWIDTATDKGELHFKANVASTTDTDFYIYYDNSAASGYAVTDTYGRNNVWTNSYEAVYHLQTSPVSNMTDSTSYGRTLTTNGGMVATNSTSSVLGNGVDFDGLNDRLTNAGFAWTAAPVTVTLWNNVLTAEVQNSNIFGFTAGAPSERFASHAPWSDNTIYWDYGSCCSAPGRISTNYTAYRNKWTHIGLVSQGSAGSFMGIFLDGSQITSAGTSDDPTPTLTGFSLGSESPAGGTHFNGRIDEFRIASVARSGGWIATERNNQSNPTGFYSVASEEVVGDGQFLTARLLSSADKNETYEEYNPTALNRNALQVGEEAEWDFSLEAYNISANTQYCFRLTNSDGSVLSEYEEYARLITNGPPQAPELSAPFDNEESASTTPWLEFAANDDAGDDVSYEVEIDNNYDFTSPVVDRDSNAVFSEFTNLVNTSERSVYTDGQVVRFIPTTALTSGTTYYWRVRATDNDGSNTAGAWSTIRSFTVNSATTITSWYQTTGEQFDTNSQDGAVISTSTNDTGLASAATIGTTTSTLIDFDDLDTGNAWGELSFTHNVTSGAIRYYVEYQVSSGVFALVPDSVLASNSSGFTSSPVSLASLNPETYNELRIVAVLTGNATLPRLQDWRVTWGLTIEEPTHDVPFDNAKVSTTSPVFTFVTSDPQGQDLEYEVQLSQTYDFAASSTFISGVDAGFLNTQTGGDLSPFASNETVSYTIQSPLTNGLTYWWRARARDPGGSITWSDYSDPTSFTVDTGITTSVWYQTTGEQFATNDLTDIETTAGGAQVTSIVRGMMMAYGEGSGQSPRYKLFDGTSWGVAETAASIGAAIVWTELKAAPTRPEYALATIGTDADSNVQIYDASIEAWGDLKQLDTTITNTAKKAIALAYETSSGDLIALSCFGTDAVYSVWNGTSWSATTTLDLTNTNNCNWIEMASDPTSDEIVAVFRHVNTSASDAEAWVWNGSSWGNNLAYSEQNEDAYQGIAVAYEESGGQAIVIGANNVGTNLVYSTWNGSAWLATSTATGTIALGDHVEWGSLKADDGSDEIALCYIDNDGNIGVIRWSGSAWGSFTEIEQTGNSKAGQAVDCEFETNGSRDGYLMVPYSDNGAAGVTEGGRYQYATATFNGEQDLSTIEDSWRVLAKRSADGTIHAVFFDDGNDRWNVTNWNGTAWSSLDTITNPPFTGTPFDGYLTMAAQIYPNFTEGAIRSTAIDFDDGTGPRWERFTFTDSTPGLSDIRYRLYYLASTSVYTLVPDSALAGNAAGFTTSPVSIATLDRTIYSSLKLDAELTCASGTCPSVSEWSLEWSEGINVSGRAYEYDGVSTTTSGTVGVVVNGSLQAGKTGTILPDGTWSIANVTAFENDSVLVFVDGAGESDEALALAAYDGVGDMTSLELTKRHLTVGSADTATTTNTMLVGYDVTDDEDIFIDIGTGGTLDMCTEGCVDHRLKIKSSVRYQPFANVTTHDVVNSGTLLLGTSTLRVRGSWSNLGTFTPDTSTVVFTATSTSETLTTSTTSLAFYNVTIGETSGTATFTPDRTIDVAGTFAVDYGTYARATTSISLERDLRIGTGGLMTGLGTTTFDGSGSFAWLDQSSGTNVGHIVVDGTAKTITLSSNVRAQSVTIGGDDTLNASGSGYTISVLTNWTNNNLFVPQSGTVAFVGTTTGTINRGTSAFNNLSFTGVGGIWSFSTSTLAVTTNLTIATGTVTLPTGTTTIGGSFLNTGGTFAHNNGEVRMTSTAAGRSITVNGTPFLNAFYDLSFSGSGAWSFTDAASTSRDMRITAGTVTFPASTLTVGGDMSVTGSGAFAHNNGQVILLVQAADTVSTNGSSFNNLQIKSAGSGSWYNASWGYRVGVTVQSSQVTESLSNFPVYVNLANLPSTFFTRTRNSGADIRVTSSDGVTEVPYELVRLSTTTSSGELHFRATTLSSTTNSTFYIYYDNPSASAYASTSTYGRNNVWSNSYQAVYHLDTTPASTMIDSTSFGRDLTQQGGMDATDVVAGAIGNGIDFDGVNDYLRNTTFAWPNASNTVTVTAWNSVTTAETKAANLFGFTESGGQRFATHGPWNDAVLYWDFGAPGVPGRVSTSYASYRNKWTHVALTSPGAGGGNMSIYFDGSFITSSTASDPSATLTGFSLGSLGASQYHDGRIDEFRIASVVRSVGWIGTEENNQSSTTAFYSVAGEEARSVRTFSDTNTTILGNLTLATGGDSVFPTGVLAVGGSFDNNALFDANNGTVRFNSSSGAETIAVGSSTFATLDFNATSGDFTITESATSTVAITLTNATQFTLQSGLMLTASGTFSQSIAGASTTWIGSTLRLLGTDHTLNSKTHSGDTYATLETANDTDVTVWNSSASSYVAGSTSSIYSADHAGVDGDLNIYGNYVRTTGTEYWSYATDFDGAVLGSPRQVDVKIATGSTIGFVSASLNLTGTSIATTTVAAISGDYSLNATSSTITAKYFSVASTGSAGFGLYSSSTLSTFEDGYFSVLPGQTGIRIDGATVNQNPAKQLERIGFATTTVGAGSNVTYTGTSTSFVWFKTGYGNLYGEAFDAGDANPGIIRFDDSSYLITVAGRVLTGDGTTFVPTPTCNGTTPNVRLVVNSGSYTASTTCNAATGAYSFSNVAFTGDPVITVYLNTNGARKGTVVTKTPTANITNLDLFADQITLRHEGVAVMTIADLTSFNYASDTDVMFLATTTPSTTLSVYPSNGLLIASSSTFTPGGDVTLFGSASSSAYEGTLRLSTSSQFIAAGTQTHTLAGRLVIGTNATLTAASSTFVMNATTTGKSITSVGTISLHNLSFTGAGGAWHSTAPLAIGGTMTIATGTVTGTGNITLTTGSLLGDGTLSLGAGTTTLSVTNTLGGIRPWTFYNLALGSGVTVGTTTPASSATTTIAGRLTIAAAHIYDVGSGALDLSGSGVVFSNSGTFTAGTGHVHYSGANATVLNTTYYNLTIGALSGSSTFTGTGAGILVQNNLQVGNGSASSTFNLATSDPVLTVNGSVTIAASGTLAISDTATTTIAGSYDNNGALRHNNGRLLFSGSGTHTIAAGTSSFGYLTIDGTGSFTVTESATSSLGLTLVNHAAFTVDTGVTLAVAGTMDNRLAGAATTWSGTLALYGGGTLSLNASSTSDVYNDLYIATGTKVRMWNSSAATYMALGGLYSQDHGGSNGLLHIYGTFNETSAADYWSYATDFDGTALSSGNERAVTVAFASGAIASWTGGSLTVVGSSTASTTLQNQGSGSYSLTLGGTVTTDWDTVTLRNLDGSGLVITGTPTVTDFSRTDHLVQVNSGTGLTVGGSAINANEAKNFTNNQFVADLGVTGAVNVTATGTALSSWRFTNHAGALSGEGSDADPAGDPGYIVWDDSAALVTVSGTVYSDEGVTLSTVCDGVTNNIVLRVAGLTTYTTSCSAASSTFSIPSVAYSPLDSLMLFIDGETEKAANITKSPISSISGMNLYEDRVIVRHENTDPMTIADMAVWDSSDDADIPFTAVDAGTDTLSLPANTKLIIWTNKTFAPGGNVTVTGGGAGGSHDGTLEALANARFRAAGTETHSIGGSFIFGAGATFEAGQSTTTFTTTGAARTIDINLGSFYNVAFTGSGSWTVTDDTFTATRSLTQSAGTLTFGSGTTTIGASFNATGGSFTMAGPALVFTSTSTGNTVRFDGSSVPSLRFTGTAGTWSMTDTDATTTGSFTVAAAGTVTLPSGLLAVAGSFDNASGTITHNTAELVMSSNTDATVRMNGSDLFALRKTGAGSLSIVDGSGAFRDDVTVASGTLMSATNTLSVGGSFTVTNGYFSHASGTLLFNATAAGKTITASTSPFYNVNFGSASGGWTTVVNNLTLTTASSFTTAPDTTITVGGVFTNLVGGVATTWSNTTLALTSTSTYTINTKLAGGDDYATTSIPSADIRSWNSTFATSTLGSTASLYSQDHGAVDGALTIYGDFRIATTTEYWNYATDFDGTTLSGGSRRAVTVRMASTSTTTLESGTLQILGAAGATSSVRNISAGTYSLNITGGTLNAEYYSFSHLSANGLNFSGTPTITNLSNGYYDLAVSSGSLITLASTTLDANASKVFTSIGFTSTLAYTGTNINLQGSTTNAWRISGSYGTLGGEAFDSDGIDACGSIRFDDSACLLTSQSAFRWRNDDGGEGAANTEWFDASWDYRKRVRIENTSATSFSTTTVKVTVAYDSDMQSDFDDIRFTKDDGLTPLDFWVEKITASTEAIVWVEVPAMLADSYTTTFMYFGNAGAVSSSTGSATFTNYDDFEDNNITEYAGDTSLFQTDTTPVYGGSYALEAVTKSSRATDGIFRTSFTTAQGNIIRWRQYINTTAGASDEACTLFGVQSPGTSNNNYGICLEQFGVDRMSLSKNVIDNDISGTVLATSSVTYTTGWYEVYVDWQSSNLISAYLYNPSGTLVATTSATDSTYSTGGMGFTFWFQNGSWDNYLVYNRGPINPPVYFGAKQTDGGASWAAAQNAFGSGIPGDVKRLRIGIENTGLTVTGQTYRLQYAAKGVAPSCEAVSSGSFAAVPNQASCGSSPVCMQSSTQIGDGDASTDLLDSLLGTFSAGSVVESPSNMTSGLTINQNYYTELEYVLTPTINASDSYCFRVVNNATPLDYYGEVAELGLQFDPTFGSVSFNNGGPIILTPNATTTIYATSTVTDFNGYADLITGTTTIYRSGVGPSCTADNNNCYISTVGGSCSFANCSGNTCVLTCIADIYFHADATDANTYEGEEWLAYMEVEDTGGGYDFASAPGIELLTLRALTVANSINYGSLSPTENTGTYNATTTISNTGNVEFDIELEGTDLSDGNASVIPADQQKFATSTFDYSACTTCSLLSSSTPVDLAVALAKPSAPTPAVTTDIYWGIAVPYGIASAAHQGINVFTPVSP
jgi:Domain of unknown function (DUF2341)/Concanavalin A-like lectin/glucanases superfamily